MLLQEADGHADNAVAPQATHVHFVHAPLTEELFHDKDERAERREFLEVSLDHPAGRDAVLAIDADVDREVPVRRDELDDGHFRGRDDLDFVGDACLAH